MNGTDHNYGFGGKEEQDELGLKWLDFSARNYDPALGRWMNLDPLAELMFTHSPFNYTFNNPIYYIDPEGLSAFPFNDETDLEEPKIATEVLPEIVIIVPKKPDVTDENDDEGSPTIWGKNKKGGTTGGRKGKSSHPINSDDIGGFPSGGENRFVKMIRAIIELFTPENNNVVVEVEPNETTMENKNEEPVEAPEPVILVPSMYVLVMYDDGKMDYVKKVGYLDKNRRTSAIDSAKSILGKYPRLDSIKAKPWFYRGLRGTEVKNERDTTIIRN